MLKYRVRRLEVAAQSGETGLESLTDEQLEEILSVLRVKLGLRPMSEMTPEELEAENVQLRKDVVED
jgi:hypothetical protein